MPRSKPVRTIAGWDLHRTDTDSITLDTTLADGSVDWERWILLRSDAHHDNLHCDRDLEREHLQQAIERDAVIFDAGDLHCAMAGKWDRRADPTQFREEYRIDYLDSLVREAAEFYAPYASHWAMMSHGNHETSVKRRHETCLTSRTCQAILDRTGHAIQSMPYEGCILLRVRRRGRSREMATCKIHFHHGSGGGGPVTLGTIQHNRFAAAYEGIDVFWQGHIHEAWVVDRSRTGWTVSGRRYHRPEWHIRTPGYKQEAVGHGYHTERGRPAKPLGAWWLRLRYESKALSILPIRAGR